MLGEDYVQSGLPSRGISELKRAASLSGGSPLYTAQGAVALAVGGWNRDALRIARELETISEKRYVSPYGLAQIYAALNKDEDAFNGCRPPMTTTLFGWDTLLLTRFSTDTARISALRIFSGA